MRSCKKRMQYWEGVTNKSTVERVMGSVICPVALWWGGGEYWSTHTAQITSFCSSYLSVSTLLFNISTNNDKIAESFDCIRLCFNAICEYFVIKTVQVPPQNPTALSSFRLTTYKSPQTANKRKLLSILITLRNRYWFHQISTISCFMR